MADRDTGSISTLTLLLRRLAGLYIRSARLSVAEKLTLLFSAVALYSVAMILGMVALVFITIGIASVLAAYIAPFWSYLIVGGVFVLIIVILFVFRKQLLINPIARFISRLVVESPIKKDKDDDEGQ